MTPTYIILHHTATARDTTTAQAIDNGHRTRNWGTASNPVYAKPSSLGYYIQYHYLITSGGTVTKARQETEIGWHAAEMNDKAIGVCLTGWFDDGHDDMPSENQVKSLKPLMLDIMKRWNIPLDRVKFHRDYANKSCPGYHITKEWVANLIGGQPVKTIMDILKDRVNAAMSNPRAYIVAVSDQGGKKYFIKDSKKEEIKTVGALREAEFSAHPQKVFVKWDEIKDLPEADMIKTE